MIAEELENLNRLREQGGISEEDFQQAKQKILGARQTSDRVLGMEDSTYCLLLHLSQVAGYLLPGLGMLLPLVLWLVGRDRSPEIDAQGRLVMNWILSLIVYMAISFFLCLLLIGIPLLISFAVLGVVFPIIGAVRAADGRRWRYPMSIPFLSVPFE